MSSSPWITGLETIKLQTMVAYSWLVVGQSVAYRLYARSVCDMNSAAAAAVCGLWRYASVICLCLCPLPVLLKPVTYSGMTNGDGFFAARNVSKERRIFCYSEAWTEPQGSVYKVRPGERCPHINVGPTQKQVELSEIHRYTEVYSLHA